MSTIQPNICSAAMYHALETPNKAFYTFLNGTQKTDFTFAELWLRSGDVAAALQARGIIADDIVVVSMPLGPDLLSSFLGAMRIGAIPTIMPYANAKQKAELFWSTHSILFGRIAPACFILSPAVGDAYNQHLPQLSSRILRTDAIKPAESILQPIAPEAIAFLQHSSGTTALKKGVKLTHSCVVDHVVRYAGLCGISKESTIFSWLPLYHDMGLISCMILPLVMGCKVTAMDNFEWVARPSSMLKAISEDRLEYAWMPNFGFAHLVRSCPTPERYDLSSLKALINCSEPCHPETHERFISHFGPAKLRPETLQVCYAMAENVFAVTQTPFGLLAGQAFISTKDFDQGRATVALPEEPAFSIASCGHALSNVDITIVDHERKPLGEGKLGEVAIQSSSLFAGYNGDEDMTSRTLVDGAYYSGDLGFLLNGELYVTGRKDDLILAYGRNLLAHELEALVNDVPGVKPGRVVVFDSFSQQIGSNVIIVMAETLPNVDNTAITRMIRVALDAGAAISPQQIILLQDGELIKTTSGKISRAGNRSVFLAHEKQGRVGT